MVELRYFTGTGNSRRMLELCRQLFFARGNKTRLASITKDPGLDAATTLLGIGFPVYSLGAPRIVRKYLQSLPKVSQPIPAFVLASIGGKNDEGWALLECQKLLAAKGYDVVLADAVLMPDNWMPMAYVPNADEAKAILAQADVHIRSIVQKLLAKKRFHKPFVMPKFGPVWSRVMHFMFHHRGVHQLWKFFKTTPACNGCGLCAKQCPLHAIQMKDKKPFWSAACEQCMRCVNSCPQKAIQQLEWVGHGSRRNQYLEPHFIPAKEI